MLSNADKYRQMIQNATNRKMLFPKVDKYEKKPTVKLQGNIKLPSLYPFKSSQQIDNNIPIKSLQQYTTTSLNDNWPKPCIGLVLCQHHQNNQTYYVYGTGILIHKKIVLTSAQNVYCRRLNRQYTNIRFIIGLCGNKCSGIYDVMRVHYPKEYTMQQEYENYNFAVLQLYDDLSKSCGYVGWKTFENIEEDEKHTVYGYISSNQQGSFNLKSQTKNGKQSQDQESYLRSGVLVKENGNKYIMGQHHQQRKEFMSEKIRNHINQWTEYIQINLWQQISAQGCKYLSQANQTQLSTLYLYGNNIGAQGCKYLSQANWRHLTTINLYGNNISAQGCKYLNQANWIHLTRIDLNNNNIGAQGCKYLSQANWIHLNTIDLDNNNIGAQGCKYLSQGNWTQLNTIDLNNNKIGAQGCKYLSQANWRHLTTINLYGNNINAQGCKYLNQANWTHLNTIDLNNNNIGAQGCKYLSQGNWTYINLSSNNIDAQGCKYLNQINWTHLTTINLNDNNIDSQGCKYLKQANWAHLTTINLNGNNIDDIIYRLLLKQLYPIITIYI